MDPRVEKSRARLQAALLELARERGIDHVSVSDIADRAGVNRTTFYLHYTDKETLLADALELIAVSAAGELAEVDLTSPASPAALRGFLNHVDEHAELYASILTEPAYSVVLSRLRTQMIAAIERLHAEFAEAEHSGVPVGIIAAGVAGSLLGMIGAWLAERPRASVAEAERWIWQVLTNPAPVRTPR